MIKRVLNIKKQVVFQDEAAGRSYRRIVGALAWPWAPAPGFLVVLGEELAVTEGLKARKLWVLAEKEAPAISELHRGCLELRNLLAADNWLADLDKDEVVRIFNQTNANLVDRRYQEIYLAQAPYAGEKVGTLLQVIGNLTQETRKVLTLGAGSKVAELIKTLRADDFNQLAYKYPPLSALGQAVGEMVLNAPWEGREMEPKVVDKWDPQTMEEIA